MIEIKELSKKYNKNVLDNISYTFEAGKLYVIKGVSGCGKTTLLNIIGGLLKDYEGECLCDRSSVGYIFQSSLLLSHLTVYENLIYINNNRELIETYAKQLNVEHLLHKTPDKLSGGERQRVSVIRTLILNPSIILADEPTASLDKNNSKELAAVINSLRQRDKVIIVATHENYFDEYADEIIHLDYGIIGKVEKGRACKDECDDLGDRDEAVETDIRRQRNKNSFKVLLAIILKRHRGRYKLISLIPIMLVVISLLLCFSFKDNYRTEAAKSYMKQYPIETFSAGENLYQWRFGEFSDGKYSEYAEIFYLYTITSDEYVCYPLLDEKNSVLAYGSLIQYGEFPDKENEVLISYNTAKKLKDEDKLQECLGQTINIAGEAYIVSGVVADISNITSEQRELYEHDCYYKKADSINVYMPYDTISTRGTRQETIECMISFWGLYEDEETYNYIKETVMGGRISIFDTWISDAQIRIGQLYKLFVISFLVISLMAAIFIKNDIEVDLFYRKRELGYLQIFGVKKHTICLQLLLERMIKNVVSLVLSVVLFYIVAIGVKLIMDINGFVSPAHLFFIFLIILGFTFLSIIIPVGKYIRKSVLNLIAD